MTGRNGEESAVLSTTQGPVRRPVRQQLLRLPVQLPREQGELPEGGPGHVRGGVQARERAGQLRRTQEAGRVTLVNVIYRGELGGWSYQVILYLYLLPPPTKLKCVKRCIEAVSFLDNNDVLQVV